MWENEIWMVISWNGNFAGKTKPTKQKTKWSGLVGISLQTWMSVDIWVSGWTLFPRNVFLPVRMLSSPWETRYATLLISICAFWHRIPLLLIVSVVHGLSTALSLSPSQVITAATVMARHPTSWGTKLSLESGWKTESGVKCRGKSSD